MNKTFKVVFNKARGALMVANEATSSVQKKGAKLVVAAAAVAVLTSGAAIAADDYSQTAGNSGFSSTTAESPVKTYEGTLNMAITGDDSRAYGLLANGTDHTYTNKGQINLNTATENASSFWKVKGMMADQGGTAVNDATINATKAYGMTVGSTAGANGEVNTIINNGTINVAGGAGMEAAPTGTAGTNGTAKAVAVNNGTISVKSGTGILISGNNGVITNAGTIDAADNYAVYVQKESDKTAKGNVVNFKTTSVVDGNVRIGSGAEDTVLNFESGSMLNGRIADEGTRSKIQGSLSISNRTESPNGAGAAIFMGSASGSLSLTNGVFANNSIQGTDVYGAAIYAYSAPVALENITFEGNSIQSNGATPDNKGKMKTGAGGGALMLKGNPGTVLTDVVFVNNSATARKDAATGGYAYGGAVMVDFSTGNATGVKRASDVTFKITKDLAYYGNIVSSDSASTDFNTYGYHLSHAQAGGFMFLDRGSKAAFDINEGATLTIGETVTTDDTDSIASSIPDQGTDTNGGQHATVTKLGNGTLVINSSLNKYYGNVVVSGGTLTVNSDWEVKNSVTVDADGILTLPSFSLISSSESGNQDVQGTAIGGSLSVSGTLATLSDQVFTAGLGAEGTATSAKGLVYQNNEITFNEGAKLAITDAVYNLDYAESAGQLLQNVNVVFQGSLASTDGIADENNQASISDLENVGPNVVLEQVTATTASEENADGGNLQIGGTTADEGTVVRTESLSVGAVDLGVGNAVTITEGKALNLAGTGGEIITSTADAAGDAPAITVSVEADSSLGLGVNAQTPQGGTLNATVELADTATLAVTGGAHYEVEAVTGSGTVTVGDASSAGRLTINSIDGMTGMIFVDPAWVNGENLASSASQVSLNYSAPITADIVAGQNSIIALGTPASDAVSAFESIAAANNLSWKENVTAAVYVGAPLTLGEGSILIDGSLTDSSQASVTEGTAVVNANGMLIANQAAAPADGALITGAVEFAEGSYLGLVNAEEGQFQLSTSSTGTALVVTDNPFIVGTVNNGTVTSEVNAESGLSAISSTGLQAMTRRADTVLAQTIADRTSVDQELKAGLNLWVDITGENYESDDFDNGGEFTADMGYGTFGGDIGFGNFTVGGAFQYGTGSLRSSVSNIKNEIDNYGVSLYGTYKVTDAFKLAAELAYVWGENDISSSQTALNQSVDTEMYSFGLRAMYKLTAGNFSFVPSIGLRVSQLSTDEMKVGSVKVDDQDQTLVQVPIALRINAADFTAGGWVVAPSMKIAYVPTFGDKDIEVLHHTQDVIDTAPVQADFGLRVGKDNMLFNVNMLLGTGEYGTSAIGGKVGFKYVF